VKAKTEVKETVGKVGVKSVSCQGLLYGTSLIPYHVRCEVLQEGD